MFIGLNLESLEMKINKTNEKNMKSDFILLENWNKICSLNSKDGIEIQFFLLYVLKKDYKLKVYQTKILFSSNLLIL